LLQQAIAGTAKVFTDPVASPTGFPFKVAQLAGSASDPDVSEQRQRICDLGYLRQQYRTPDGAIGYRCSAEPVGVYVAKGGNEADTHGRKCLCNALMANIGHSQVRNGTWQEPPMITAGNDLLGLARFTAQGEPGYSAADVLAALLKDSQDA
ncbi:MAG: nitronate monooxygenase, partial [Terriglobales bacterium]